MSLLTTLRQRKKVGVWAVTECSTLCFSLISRYCWRKHSNTTGLNLTQNFSGFAVSTYTDTLLVYMKCVVLTQKVMHSGERNVELAPHSIQAMYNENRGPPTTQLYFLFLCTFLWTAVAPDVHCPRLPLTPSQEPAVLYKVPPFL